MQINVRDVEICNSIQEYKKYDYIFIYGAGQHGKEAYRLLTTIGLSNLSFVDQNVSLQSDIVLSPESFFSRIKEDIGNICIVACVSNLLEFVRFVSSKTEMVDKCIDLFSYFAVSHAFFLNRNVFSNENNQWISAKYNYVNMKKKRQYQLYAIDTALQMLDAEDETIMVLQPGKVGSTTLCNQLSDCKISTIHQHSLNYSRTFSLDMEKEWKEAFDKYFSTDRRIITMVREPIARDYSAFWQAFSSDVMHAWRMPETFNDYQRMYDWFLDLITNGTDYTINYLKTSFPQTWRNEFSWFDEEIKQYLGIDIFEYPFDREKGYSIIKRGKVSIFLFKLEYMSKIQEELSDFIGLKKLSDNNANEAALKDYSLAYTEFKKMVKIPRDYVKNYYENNSKMDHFYTENEKKSFLSKWEANII